MDKFNLICFRAHQSAAPLKLILLRMFLTLSKAFRAHQSAAPLKPHHPDSGPQCALRFRAHQSAAPLKPPRRASSLAGPPASALTRARPH